MTAVARARLGKYLYEEHASITQAVLAWHELRPEDRGAWIMAAVALAAFLGGRFEAAGVDGGLVVKVLDGLGEVAPPAELAALAANTSATTANTKSTERLVSLLARPCARCGGRKDDPEHAGACGECC